MAAPSAPCPPVTEPPTSPSWLPAVECNNPSLNMQAGYPIFSTPMIPLDPMFAWLYPSILYDSGFWSWVAANYPFGGLGPALTNYGPVGSPQVPWMMNSGQGVGQLVTVPTSPGNVLPPNTPVEVEPATVAPDVMAVQGQESGNDQHADNQQ
jgi:hypothetical protein